jgi:hypothetical protein
MELKAENVKNIRSLAVCKEFLRQAIEQNDQLNEELRHQKHKRCKALAFACAYKMQDLLLADPDYVEWLAKWRDRWNALAEKFKENK